MLQYVMLSPLSKPNSRIVADPNIFGYFFPVSWVFDWCTINNHQVHINSLVKLCSAIDLSCSDMCRVLQNMCLLCVCVYVFDRNLTSRLQCTTRPSLQRQLKELQNLKKLWRGSNWPWTEWFWRRSCLIHLLIK